MVTRRLLNPLGFRKGQPQAESSRPYKSEKPFYGELDGLQVADMSRLSTSASGSAAAARILQSMQQLHRGRTLQDLYTCDISAVCARSAIGFDNKIFDGAGERPAFLQDSLRFSDTGHALLYCILMLIAAVISADTSCADLQPCMVPS